ncbi:hypothetical protein CDEST_15556 [Colletotrichum destructivum]|uniref:Uncharacterized protein n=1 Tax=Colletotrichum destructivum TaxID=34406 RepID=A0AAX4J5J3_9PEZI|nr:hypothetical protein CDEST_15556 [Colletotrichum destructivum]
MHQSQQRSQRPGKLQRRSQISTNQARHRETILTTRLVQALQRNKGLSPESIDWPKSIIQKPLMSSTTERLHDSNGPQDQDPRGYQDVESVSMSSAFQKPPSVWFCHMIAVERAVAEIEEANEKHFKATTFLLDQLESKLTILAVAVEDTATLTPICGAHHWPNQN